jgi:hypothetical protein
LLIGTYYPCIEDFRLVVRQHAIMKEFELGTEKSDRERFRGFCAFVGYPWCIIGKTQHDGSVRVYFVDLNAL